MTYEKSQRQKHRYLTDLEYRERKKRIARERQARLRAERIKRKAA